MTQARRNRNPKKAGPEPEPEQAPPTAETMYLAAEHLAALGLQPEQAAQTVADSQVVLTWLTQTVTWRSRPELVRLATQAWGEGSTDRLNAALGLLERSGRVLRI